MFVLNLVFFALAASNAHSGIAPDIRGQWVIAGESPQYEYEELVFDESVWPESPAEVELVTGDQALVTTQEPHVRKEQDGGEESSVWEIVLVTAILLVSMTGALSLAYYMRLRRGGRIHYKPQKNESALE